MYMYVYINNPILDCQAAGASAAGRRNVAASPAPAAQAPPGLLPPAGRPCTLHPAP